MANKKRVIELGSVQKVNHETEYLHEAFGISEARSKIIKLTLLDITDKDTRVSEVLCDTAEQFKGNELLYALFMLSEMRNKTSSCDSRSLDIDDISEILDGLLSKEED